MKLPRDVDGPKLAKALKVLGYEATRQTGLIFELLRSATVRITK